MKEFWLRAAGLCCALVLVSCGGGGGGSTGGGGGSGGGGNSPTITVTSDRASLDFVGFTGTPPRAQSVGFTLLNATAGTYYGQIVPDRPSDFAADFTPTGTTTATVTLTPLNTSVGQRSGSIVVRLCTDSGCNQVAWSQTIPYRYTMFTISSGALSFSGFEGGTASTKTVAITPADTNGQLLVSTSVNAGSGWLSASHEAANAISVTPTAASLSAGTYTGTVKVQLAGEANSPMLIIPVGFTVGTGFVAPVAGNLDLTVGATAPAGSTQIAFNGDLSPAWTASSDQAWLVLDTPSGNGAGTLQYHVDVARLGSIANWSSSAAQVTVRAAGLRDMTLPVTINKRLPEVYVISPATVVAGRASTVRVTGRGLSQLSGIGRITISGASGITGTVTSDSEAILNVPALTEGRAAVSVTNAAGFSTWTSTLGAASLSALPGSTAANGGEKRSALFDPTRNALYAINLTQSTLVRYRYTSGQWQIDGLPVASIGDLAMSPDRKTLYVGSGSKTLLAVDPDTLQIKTTHTTPNGSDWSISPSKFFTRGMALTNNLRLWFGDSQWSSMAYFDILSSRFGVQTLGAGISLYSPEFYAPPDGSKLYVVNPPMVSPSLPSYAYSPASGSISAPANLPGPGRSVNYNETGSKVLVDDESLYNGSDFSLIGKATITGAIGTNAVLSPDGSRLYRLVTKNNNNLVVDHINVYDTARVQAGTSVLVKLGQIPVTTQAVDCGTQAPYGCDVRGTFVISPLGDTLFWVGNQRLVVFPISSGLSGVLAAPQRMLSAVIR